MKINKCPRKHIHYYIDEIPELLDSLFKNNINFENIADLGCGDGAILFALSKKGYLQNIKTIFALDISAERIDAVRKIDEKITCQVADVSNLNIIQDNFLDLVISNQVIEHIPDEDRFVKEMSRVLRPHGLLYLSTVFKKWYGWYFYRNSQDAWVLDPAHLREYTQEENLLDIIKKYNFSVIKNRKHLQWFPVTDFFCKRLGLSRRIYQNKIIRYLRMFKIPIPGYYNWEMLLVKGLS